MYKERFRFSYFMNGDLLFCMLLFTGRVNLRVGGDRNKKKYVIYRSRYLVDNEEEHTA